ncbi:putative mitochondrial DEAD box protein [Leishmania major strain Friedlin]|uniref:RNA helicase n=1 Tax=Leishmania major TaxID=5664 RepID=Q4Q858_LEIMA|nr:putative mitochondrial DEAD box protein [Leishmania major strain Friedlin]CAG9577319.1 DEAD-box_ATP-dependent_RNA_helicase_-_mitochondrial [Leishmania major strain Friedlin]CAJ05642.1 putative mitochondrial DEAD box protein [Leishmania major strain Friedlin]|eukprot:XP_001684490.1 putative mitochondrial DEAD box protein [Leishmania major strain Friedlin]
MRRFASALFGRWGAAQCGVVPFRARPTLLPMMSRVRCFSVISAAYEGLAPATSSNIGDPHAPPKTRASAVSTEHDVSITDGNGDRVDVTPLNSFEELRDAPRWLAEGLKTLKYPSTTDIQKFTIPLLANGHDVIGLAPTGSGKTVAFAVPALAGLKPNPDGTPSVLVLAPTRELVQQTTKVFQNLGCGQVRVCEAYGGAPRDLQARHLRNGCDALVACPGRLKDFLDGGDVSIRNLSFLVFDEADRLLDMGFQVHLDEIMAYLDSASHPQTMMWSATWPESVQAMARKYLSDDRVLIRAGTAGAGLQVNERIKQELIFCRTFTERIEKLGSLVEDGTIDDNKDKLIIFVERQADTENTARAFSHRLGIDTRYVGTIHGGLSQRQRDRVMSMFKSNHIRLLVATDVASRGLDIPDVTCVVNFQAPKTIDSYCHRIGRTGRAGRTGTAYTFLGEEDGGLATELVNYLTRCHVTAPKELTQLAESYQHRMQQQRQRFRRVDRGGFSRSENSSGFGRRRSDRGGSREFMPRRPDSRKRDDDLPSTLDW